VLLVHLSLAPAEGVQELEGAHGISPCLQVIEDSLQAKRDALEVICISGHLVNGSTEVSDEEKCLQK
jgi:hypothetical protein